MQNTNNISNNQPINSNQTFNTTQNSTSPTKAGTQVNNQNQIITKTLTHLHQQKQASKQTTKHQKN